MVFAIAAAVCLGFFGAMLARLTGWIIGIPVFVALFGARALGNAADVLYFAAVVSACRSFNAIGLPASVRQLSAARSTGFRRSSVGSI